MRTPSRVLLLVLALTAAAGTTGCLGFGAGCGPLRALVGIC
ncbi:MAG: hypothetical protein U0169_21665 [Polyangiaceae bacterium]